MTNVDQEFVNRASHIPGLGLGLSVDVYSPDLGEVMRGLGDDGLSCAYLEVFEAPAPVLSKVRDRWPAIPLAYHADGLWVTEPRFETCYGLRDEMANTVAQLKALNSLWLTQECATKQIAGYAFGTYLPPFLSDVSARVTACNIALIQRQLDDEWSSDSLPAPLFLLETPPLSYFLRGHCSYQEFFREVVSHVSCGLVFDVGHIWTVFRYGPGTRFSSFKQFLKAFLPEFPLERVVQIHLAGLAPHCTHTHRALDSAHSCPLWLDAHGAPIPLELFEGLDLILADARLASLRGLALEVDTKDPALIRQEFEDFRRRFEWWKPTESWSKAVADGNRQHVSCAPPVAPLHKDIENLVCHYDAYIREVTGRSAVGSDRQLCEPNCDAAATIGYYVQDYLPHEILEWGGNIREMFPKTMQIVNQEGVLLDDFVQWWFDSPRTAHDPYDFFLIKIDQFLSFIAQRLPCALDIARREAEDLQIAYARANEDALSVECVDESA